MLLPHSLYMCLLKAVTFWTEDTTINEMKVGGTGISLLCLVADIDTLTKLKHVSPEVPSFMHSG